MRSTVDDVHAWGRKLVRSLLAGKLGEVDVQRDALRIHRKSGVVQTEAMFQITHLLCCAGLSDSHGDTKDGVGAELALVGRTVGLDEEVIDSLLVGDLETRVDERGTKDLDNVLYSLADSLAEILGLVAISELNSFVDTS